MTSQAWVVDASVALKWFLPIEHEPQAPLARSAIGRLAMRTTSLAVHEIGNILTRQSGLSADQIVSSLRVLLDICGDPIPLTSDDHELAVRLALEHGLTFYDASDAAIAVRSGRRLLSADEDLLAPGLAVSLDVAVVDA